MIVNYTTVHYLSKVEMETEMHSELILEVERLDWTYWTFSFSSNQRSASPRHVVGRMESNSKHRPPAPVFSAQFLLPIFTQHGWDNLLHLWSAAYMARWLSWTAVAAQFIVGQTSVLQGESAINCFIISTVLEASILEESQHSKSRNGKTHESSNQLLLCLYWTE